MCYTQTDSYNKAIYSKPIKPNFSIGNANHFYYPTNALSYTKLRV